MFGILAACFGYAAWLMALPAWWWGFGVLVSGGAAIGCGVLALLFLFDL